MRRVALALLALCAMVGSAEARTLFSARLSCADNGGFTTAVKGTILLHFRGDVATVKARVEGLVPGATASAGYLCTIEGTAPAATACSTPAEQLGQAHLLGEFPGGHVMCRGNAVHQRLIAGGGVRTGVLSTRPAPRRHRPSLTSGPFISSSAPRSDKLSTHPDQHGNVHSELTPRL